MKFLCEECGAKYQIADDKIAGKSVRMNCRRCGHTINVSSGESAGIPIEGSASAADARTVTGIAVPASTAARPVQAENIPPGDDEDTALFAPSMRPSSPLARSAAGSTAAAVPLPPPSTGPWQSPTRIDWDWKQRPSTP